jgi:hypothetical protein
MSTIHQELLFPVSPERVYEALTNANQFSQLSGGAPTDISADPGASFSCFGGMILGRNIELIRNQAWRAKPWESETRVVFDHTGFPSDLAEHLDDRSLNN